MDNEDDQMIFDGKYESEDEWEDDGDMIWVVCLDLR